MIEVSEKSAIFACQVLGASFTMSISPFYINILLLNRDEVVSSAVASKTGSKTSFFGRAAAFAATKLVSDEKIINTLSSTLISKISAEVDAMGIQAEITKRYQQGPYVVIKVTVRDVDKKVLLSAAKGASFADSFSHLLSSIEALNLSESVLPSINTKILSQVHDSMMTKFAEVLPSKLAESGLDVECSVCGPADQAEMLFEIVERLNA